ncbi:MAG: hypothetical protein RL757_2434 [Bacteroidota bacterium]
MYGFVRVPRGLLLDLIEHRYFQRLRRIGQNSLVHYIYPGALHTRFHHALGAFHLMTQAIAVLRSKGVAITAEEEEGAQAAILLHDIGHGPFSHTLEHTIIAAHHEDLSDWLMRALNEEFDGKLDLAIRIFENRYPKHFLHQLISGQLDLDRMDYISRDAYFTGVAEGVIGHDRLISMLAVADGELVVEEKAIYSLERFLTARRLMYWQVYLHKTAIAAEQMLIRAFERAKMLQQRSDTGGGAFSEKIEAFGPLNYFLHHTFALKDNAANSETAPSDWTEKQRIWETNKTDIKAMLQYFAKLDDVDVWASLKMWSDSSDFVLSYLSKNLLERNLFRVELEKKPIAVSRLREIEKRTLSYFQSLDKSVKKSDLPFLIVRGAEKNLVYNLKKEEINLLFKNGKVGKMSESVDISLHSENICKYFIGYSKRIF